MLWLGGLKKLLKNHKKGAKLLKNYLLIGLGSVLLVLGGIGIAIPVLPTTPFVLLASACFAGSSPRLYNWLSQSRYFGEFIRNYKSGTGVTKNTKIRALVFLYATLGLSFFLVKPLFVKILLPIIAIAVTIHIMVIRTKDAS